MFRLFKIAFGLVFLAGLAWFSLAVNLGSRTLYQHVRAIGGSAESQELVRGTREKVMEVKGEVGRKMFGDNSELAKQQAPAENITAADRQAMRRLLDNLRQ